MDRGLSGQSRVIVCDRLSLMKVAVQFLVREKPGTEATIANRSGAT